MNIRSCGGDIFNTYEAIGYQHRVVVRRIMAPEDVHVLIPGTCECVKLAQNGYIAKGAYLNLLNIK